MKISENEMELFALFAVENKEGTMKNLEMAEPFIGSIGSALAKDMFQSIYGKLEEVSEEEYRVLWAKSKSYFVRKNSQWFRRQKDLYTMIEEGPDIRGTS